jgi:hypothetical protein
MKLPSFLEDIALNELRARMGGAPLGILALERRTRGLTVAELEVLITGGIDIRSLDEIRVLKDGTLAYKDRRVVLYIRDISEYVGAGSAPENLPKFHVSNCKKLQEMRSQNRLARYVVAARDDGQFQINVTGGSSTRSALRALRVCQYCLGELRYRDFSHEMSREQRLHIVAAFTVRRFFELWPRDLIDAEGLDSETSAPLNDYTGDFGEHAATVKARAGHRCRECNVSLSAASHRRFLHAHHVNGVKFDNRAENLVPLCIRCHANQPGHSHLKAAPDFKHFCALFPEHSTF